MQFGGIMFGICMRIAITTFDFIQTGNGKKQDKDICSIPCIRDVIA